MLFQNKTTGFVPDSFDPRDVWLDEVLAGDETLIPPKYIIEGLNYEMQGAHPFCVSFAATTMLEHKYGKEGVSKRLSQMHLFFHAGGWVNGSSFRPNMTVLVEKGAVDYDKCPMPKQDYGNEEIWLEKLKAQALAVPFNEPTLLGGYARVIPDTEHLQKAIMEHGALLVGVSASGKGYYSGNGKREKKTDNHAVLLVGWTPEHWVIFDSLNWVKKTAGYGTLSREYTFNTAYAATELPKNWKKKVEKVRSKPYEDALSHYGKPRNWQAEKDAEAKLMSEFTKFNNQSVMDAAGRFWTVLINAAAYGGYSVSYTKFGMWQPGDLINFVYHWRRTGEYLFDLNKVRN